MSKRILTAFLAMCLILSSLTATAFAVDTEEQATPQTEVETLIPETAEAPETTQLPEEEPLEKAEALTVAPDATGAFAIGDQYYDTLGDAIAAVPTDGTQTTINLLQDSAGDGVVIKAGQNIVINFGGHTYTVSGATVGSPGTKTSAFQMLKGATVTMLNGTLNSVDAVENPNLKVMFQNYCDLTLTDMTVDARNAANVLYVLSVNHGNVTVNGNTSLLAPSGKTALDVYYWPSNGYGDGCNVTVDITGTLSGRITYGCENTAAGKQDVAEKTVLKIQNATVDGEISTYNLTNENETGIQISGGTFNAPLNEHYIVDGYAQVDGVIGKDTVQDESDTAVVNGQYFKSIQTAVDTAAANGGTVTLIKDTVADVVIESGSVVLDLGGYTLTNDVSDTIAVRIGAELTVIGEGTIDNKSHGKAAVFNDGMVNLQGGSYDRTSESGVDSDISGGNSWYTICNHGSMTVQDGVTVRNKGGFSSLFENGYYAYNDQDPRSGHVSGINAEHPKLVINGGSFVGGLNTIKNDDGAVLEINGGSFTNTAQAAVLNWNEATINGGNFETQADSCILNGATKVSANPLDQGKLTITGGTFTSKGTPVANNIIGEDLVTVVGGTFSGKIDEAFIPEGNKLVDENGSFTVGVDTAKAVAEIDGVGYLSLQAAVDAVPVGGEQATTIKLVRSVSGGGVKLISAKPKNIVFDFAGHTYTIGDSTVGSPGTESQGFHLEKGSTVTIKNGTLKASTNEKLKMMIQNYCDLTLTDLTVDASQAPQCLYALSCNNGNVVVNGSTSLKVAEGNTALDAMYWPKNGYIDGVKVTVNTTGEIVGKVEYGFDGAAEDMPEVGTKAVLNIVNGKFDGKISTYGISEGVEIGIAVSGGSFTSRPNDDFLADGFVVNQNQDGTFGVHQHEASVDRVNLKQATCTETGYTGDVVCAICGEVIEKGEEIPALGHKLEKVAGKEPTIAEAGNIEYYVCPVCGKLFKDAEGTVEITLEDTVIPQLEKPTEPQKPTDPQKPTEPQKPTVPQKPVDPNRPSTGDSTDAALMLGMMLVALSGIVFLVAPMVKKHYRGKYSK